MVKRTRLARMESGVSRDLINLIEERFGKKASSLALLGITLGMFIGPVVLVITMIAVVLGIWGWSLAQMEPYIGDWGVRLLSSLVIVVAFYFLVGPILTLVYHVPWLGKRGIVAKLLEAERELEGIRLMSQQVEADLHDSREILTDLEARGDAYVHESREVLAELRALQQSGEDDQVPHV